MQPQIYVLTGPTAVGKTELSLLLAKKLNAEILSCDALLFYKGLDIGTAKPSPEEQAVVTHHGIDLVPPSEQFSILRYIDYAQKCIEDISSRSKNILVTGGSGFYLKAFFKPVTDNVVVPQELIDELHLLYEKEGIGTLQNRIQELNPGEEITIDIQNPRRLVQAIARCTVSGKTLQALKKEFDAMPSPFAQYKMSSVLLNRDREILRKRVLQRVELMVQAGLVEEVKKLLTLNIKENPTAATAIGYRETIEHIEQNTSKEELISLIAQNTMRLVKKQSTWFRHQIDFDQTIDLDTIPSPEEAMGQILSAL